MYDDSSYDTAEGEMNTYSALCIIITAVKKPTIKMNCPEKILCTLLCLIKKCQFFD
jgi:hypothetical protein